VVCLAIRKVEADEKQARVLRGSGLSLFSEVRTVGSSD
jgi:hypothetical protein